MGDSELANPDSWSYYHLTEIHLQQRGSPLFICRL